MEAKLKELEQRSVPGPAEAQDARTRELQNEMLKSKEAVERAPANYAAAERDYYTYKSGAGGYADHLRAQFEREAKDLKRKTDDAHAERMARLKATVKTYETTLRYAQNMDVSVGATLEEVVKVAAQKAASENAQLTNNRKAHYVDQDFTGVVLWSQRLDTIFYACGVVLLTRKAWVQGVGVALVPALLPKVVAYFNNKML